MVSLIDAIFNVDFAGSQHLVGQGGYLDSQTPDTQYFGDDNIYDFGSQQEISTHTNDISIPDYTDDNVNLSASQQDYFPSSSPPHEVSVPQSFRSSKSNATSSSAFRGRIDPKLLFTDRRGDTLSGAKAVFWEELDARLNGPGYDKKNCAWLKLPTLKQFRPDFNVNTLMRDLRQASHSPGSVASVDHDHIFTVHRITGATFYTPNIIQGELAYLAGFLSQLYPLMVMASADSDLSQMRSLIKAGHDLLESMEILVSSEAEVREAMV